MRLFAALFREKKLRLPLGFKGPKGHIFRGKYRLVKKVTYEAVEDLKADIEIEEKNMLYLRNPYLTWEQSAGHAIELKKNQKWHARIVAERENRFSEKRNKTIYDQVKWLGVNEDWDRIPS